MKEIPFKKNDDGRILTVCPFGQKYVLATEKCQSCGYHREIDWVDSNVKCANPNNLIDGKRNG